MVKKTNEPLKPTIRIFADYGNAPWIWGSYPDGLCYDKNLKETALEKSGFNWSARWEIASEDARKLAKTGEDFTEITPPGWDWDAWNKEGEQLAQCVRDKLGDDYEVVHIEQRDFV